MKLTPAILALIGATLYAASYSFGAFPTDAAGFATYPLASGAREWFASSSAGNDTNPGTLAAPLKTPPTGRLSPGDHLLLKSGDTFGPLGNVNVSGIDADHPTVISSYGPGERPIVACPAGGQAFGIDGRGAYHDFAASHIHFYCSGRNIADPAYDPAAVGVDSFCARFMAFGGVKNILIQDCKIDYFTEGFQFEGGGTNGVVDAATVDRCIIVDNYAVKCQGLYLSACTNWRITSNFFAHNGYTDDGRFPIPILNHSVYVQSDCGPGVCQFNTFSQSDGAQVRGGGLLADNLFDRCVIAGFVGQVPSQILRNVVVGGMDFAPYSGNDGRRANGLQSINCDAVIDGNLVVNKLLTVGDGSSWPYELSEDKPGYAIKWGTNRSYNWGANRISLPTPANTTGAYPIVTGTGYPTTLAVDPAFLAGNRNRPQGVLTVDLMAASQIAKFIAAVPAVTPQPPVYTPEQIQAQVDATIADLTKLKGMIGK